MNANDISELEYLYFNSSDVDRYIPYLTKVAEINPNIGLGYEGDISELDKIIDLFKPEFIVGMNLPQKDF